jgi:hypothetical protein
MKTISRILILLAAAFIVIGMTYAISQTTAAQALIGSQRRDNRNAGLATEFANGQGNLPSVVSGRSEGSPQTGDSLVMTLGRNLLIMGMIIFSVQLLWSIGRQLQRITHLPL